MRKISFSFLILCMFFSLILTGCSNETTTEDTKSKVSQELEYLDKKILTIANKLNNITLQNYTISSKEVLLGEESSSSGQSSEQGNSSGGNDSQQKQSTIQNGGEQSKESNITTTQIEAKPILSTDKSDINWDDIKNEIEIINRDWSVVILDLSSLNLDNEEILGFSSALDDCTLSIKNENKADALINVSKLYSYIPKFEKAISADKNTQNIKQVKANIINAYSFVEQENWLETEASLKESEILFKEVANDLEYIKDKEYKINKTYVFIKELQNSLSYKDKDLFYVKYKNLIESINTL